MKRFLLTFAEKSLLTEVPVAVQLECDYVVMREADGHP